MSITRDFLLQFSLVIVPFGIYLAYLFGHIRIKKHIRIFLMALWGSSIILCISFPMSYGYNMNHDFRIVPLLIGTLYGGADNRRNLSRINYSISFIPVWSEYRQSHYLFGHHHWIFSHFVFSEEIRKLIKRKPH